MRTRTDLTADQIAELGALVSGRISTNDSVLDLHGRDESAFPPVKPSAVITVHSTEEVSAVLKYCNTHDIPVVAFGAGTSLEGHVLPLFGGISLDLSAMDKILEISPDDLTVRVQAGVKRMALNKKIASDGLFFSVDPGADATIGGMTSTGAAGTTTVRYGSMRENVLKLTAVLADGTIIHAGRETRKLSAGYDLTRLIVGSEGTLAIVTEITLRVFGIPEKMAAAVSRFPTLADGVQAAIAVVRSGVAIARCEFLDAQCIKNVNAHDGLDLEEAPTLLFEFHGSPRSVEEDAQVVQEIAAEFGGTNFEWTSEEGARRKLWQARHNAYWAGISAHPGKRAISTDAAVPLSKLAEAVALTEKILSESPFPFSILGHVADGNFHAFIITDPNKPEELPAVRELTHHMTDAIIDMGGTCTGEHGIGAGKISSLEKEAGPGSMAVMASIKNALDPKGILNPGKIFN
ncbi:oxidoreductase [Actinomycetes bacterium]|nr:oxidoreductase [Actinomycetes bacterium]